MKNQHPLSAGHVSRSQRGSVIILSLVVIFALTGLGLVALNRATTATLTASTFNINRQANYVAELAVNGVVEELACAPERYLAPMTVIQQETSARTTPVTARWDGTTFCNQASAFYRTGDFGRRDNQPRFEVLLSDNRLASDEAGYEAGGSGSAGSDQPCHIRMRIEARGVMNIPGRSAANFLEGQDVRTDIVRRASGYVTVGPFLNSVICANAGSL